MKKLEKIISSVCVFTSVLYVLTAAILVLGQAGSLALLNGEMSVALYSALAKPAGYFAAVTALLSIVLSYFRGDMKS